uniref:uncharacterized protein LOC100187461 isoform X1 n=1 Tax=Ciona intestinalis TaxID=7719 RepID=UPI000180BDC8|nr:uncharacterized protein LOC100187461 isoform X1 [Ciona intestinalis]|eukprot:XP_002127798.1 uncharacterized protein LOC100187461 isoform X1 [Ciona intestinalis]
MKQPTTSANLSKQAFNNPPQEAPDNGGGVRTFMLIPQLRDTGPKFAPNPNVPDSFNDSVNNVSSPTPLVAIIAPIACIVVLLLLTFSARKVWVKYKLSERRNTTSNFDLGGNYEETIGLNSANLDMQIVQETNTSSKDTDTMKVAQQSLDEDRPSSLKFLAASVAFQNSTVPACTRLPYTPDPDYILNEEEDSCDVIKESKDNVAPLVKQRTRMKPRGLLERRGSNVALTISLRSGEKQNPVAAKSPKPLTYLRQASCELTPAALHTKSCDTLQLQQEFWEIPMNHPFEKNFNVAGHGTKNRYRSILPNEHSRVKLPVVNDNDPLSSYINANYIRKFDDVITDDVTTDDITPVTRSNAAYIATQGPMGNTLDDFWRMAWHEAAASVVMITKLKERKEKCSQYLPMAVGESSTYDDITITVESIQPFEHFTVRKLTLTHVNGESRELNHYWYTSWMDHETPEKTRGLLELVQEVTGWDRTQHGPIIVHCSAGIGRTGCYIAVTTGCQQLLQFGKVDVLKIVSRMRLDRGGMIQTWEQYQFVHQALGRYARILAGENVTTPSTSSSIRSPPEPLTKGDVQGTSKPPATPCTPIGEVPGTPKRPQTPKHRRSFSATNLPASKEIKISDPLPLEAPKVSSPRLKVRKSKPKLHISTTPPPTCDITKPSASPTIRSPFGRLCLQNKEPSPSPLANFKFDWPETSGRRAPPGGKLKLKQTDENDVKLGGRFPQVKTEVARSPLADRHNGIMTSQRRHFAFDLPPLQMANGVKVEGAPSSDDKTPTSGASGKSVKSGGSNEASDRFVFPAPDKR